MSIVERLREWLRSGAQGPSVVSVTRHRLPPGMTRDQAIQYAREVVIARHAPTPPGPQP